MPDLHAQLISIYSSHDTTAVGAAPEYVALCHDHEDDDAFHALRARIHDCKEKLEKWVGIHHSTADQVRFSLKALQTYKKDDRKFELGQALIRATYRDAWSPAQQAHFDHWVGAMLDRYDFFLSFTTRSVDAGEPNSINRWHKHLIVHMLTEPEYRKSDLKSNNLLARSINLLLKEERLEGYYFPDDLGTNQKVIDKMLSACERSYVFVQLVQNVMFVGREGTNYCHHEFLHAKDKLGSPRMRFVLAEGKHHQLLPEEDVADALENWYDEVRQRDIIELERTEWFDEERLRTQVRNIKALVADAVKKVKQELLIDSVPD